MRVLAIEPYFGLSHRTFLEGLQRHSGHEVTIWSLPPRKWKWRMRGSAYHFAEVARELGSEPRFDLLLVSDFLNLPDFLALAPRWFRAIPTVAYFHENQATYPLGANAPVDFHYAWINLSTALCADRVFFNSYHHRESFLAEVRRIFARMPDYVPERLLERLSESSRVFPVGIDFTSHDAAIAERGERSPLDDRPPRILWNHRWEYDKGPELFFSVLGALRAEGTPFRLVVCGQSFRNRPEVFDVARRELADRIDHFGFFAQYGDYVREAVRCDVVVSTAIHEFFGVATLDAMYCGCLPVLPRRLSYPELIPPHMHPLFLYDKDEDLPDFLRRFLAQPPVEYRAELRRHMARYDWRELAPIFDRELDALP